MKIGTLRPKPCPECGSESRFWDLLPGGGVNAGCDQCGRSGCHDNLKRRELDPEVCRLTVALPVLLKALRFGECAKVIVGDRYFWPPSDPDSDTLSGIHAPLNGYMASFDATFLEFEAAIDPVIAEACGETP